MAEDQNFQNQSGANPDLVNQAQGQAGQQQGSTAPDAIDTGIDSENEGDLGTGADVVGIDGEVLNEDGSADGNNVANDDEDLDDNSQAEDDPQADEQEQQAT